MKKMYYVPETEITWVTMEQSFLSNGENLNMRNYGDGSGEDIDGFWD